MHKIILFADNYVGVECTKFILSKYYNTISYIVVTDKESIVYEMLINSSFCEEKIVFSKDLKSFSFDNVDYIFLLWWPKLINKDIINSADGGVINTHPSLLPYNRGKHYNFWNLVENVPFGVSLHFIDEGIDSGDIIFQNKIDKTWEDTGESLYKKAQLEMIKLLKQNFENIMTGNYERKKQDLHKGSYHNSVELEKSSEIILSKMYTAEELLNLLRARTFPPHNSCYFYDNGTKYEVSIKIKKEKNG